MGEDGKWAAEAPEATSWKPPVGRTATQATREQDHAAGGRDRRRVALPAGGVATASIELKLTRKGRRVYAYLRYSFGGRTVNRYVGEAIGSTREERLICAWRIARRKKLLLTQRATKKNSA